jgi:hypothetical protein
MSHRQSGAPGTSRRSVIKVAANAAWAAPAVTLLTAVPATASASPGGTCSPAGWKHPGLGKNTKDYEVILDCGAKTAVSVTLTFGSDAAQALTLEADGHWWLRGQPDSQSPGTLSVTFSDGTTLTEAVLFHPAP